MSLITPQFEHHRWANLAVVEFMRTGTAEQLAVRAPGAIYGAHECMIHLAHAEQSYCESLTGAVMDLPAWVPGQPPTLDELYMRLDATGTLLVRVAAEAQETTVASGEYRGRPFSVPATVFLFTALTHAAEHREQAKACLTLAGLEAPDVGFWSWHSLRGT